MAQIFSTTAKPITIFEAYKDFENKIFTKNASHPSIHKNDNHVINLMDNK